MPNETFIGTDHPRPSGLSLADVMADPIVHLVMRRDGLTPDDVWPLMLDAQRRLRGRRCRVAERLAA